ncbi:hypothetical protein [Paenibacillus sp. MBLB4367]|uniref:hypothetical protein n=1 Tax=Paenibacillus sp. MBLB4367 TaxID=3384767 RepID=UPI003907F863
MNIEKLADTYANDLPGLELVGYIEIGVPVFKRTLHCLEISKKPLPVIEEFVLRLSNLGVVKEELANILGIDETLVSEAWWNLVHKDLIELKTHFVSERGQKYIVENKMDTYEKVLLHVGIDGLLGTVQKERAYMAPKKVRENGLKPLNVLIEQPSVQNINIQQVRQVYKKSKEEDQYEGDLLDIYHVEGSKTQFRRLSVLIYSDGINKRFMVYDGKHVLNGYEKAIFMLEERGFQLIKNSYDEYFQNDRVLMENLDIKNPCIGPGEIFTKWNNLLDMVKKKLVVSIPMIDICGFSDYWLECIQRALDKKVEVIVIFSGREFTGSYIKEQYDKLRKLKRSNNLIIKQMPSFTNKLVIADETEGVITDFERFQIDLPKSKYCFKEKGYILSEQNILEIMKEFLKEEDEIKNIPAVSQKWLSDNLLVATELISQFDELLKSANGVGCLGDESIPDLQKLLDSPLATNEITFKTFINVINQSLVETFEKVWKRSGLSKVYFFSDFKVNQPGVQKVLHKIKLYRHSTHHLSLEDRFKPTYYSFLDEDLNGCLPQFKKDGFLILQYKIISELVMELKKALS